MRAMIFIISLFAAVSCVTAPNDNIDTKYAEQEALLKEADTVVVDKSAVGDEAVTDDSDTVSKPACLEDPCTTHADCKKEGCVATFCTAELGVYLPSGAPKVCVLRCDPANNNTDCPEGLTCNGQVAMLGAMADGAKGICATPTAIK